MRFTSFGLLAAVGIGAVSMGTPAGAQITAFHIVSAATQECLHLRTPDKPGGGGLALKRCERRPAFAFSLERSTSDATPIMVSLTSSRSVCVVAADEPSASLPTPLPVTTVECGGRGSLWFHSGPLDQHVIRKADRAQMPCRSACR